MGYDHTKPQKKPYEKPTAAKLTQEQAKLKLQGHTMMGNKNAVELLDMFFERRKQNHDDTERKKSA